jgi:hypothetical protein
LLKHVYEWLPSLQNILPIEFSYTIQVGFFNFAFNEFPSSPDKPAVDIKKKYWNTNIKLLKKKKKKKKKKKNQFFEWCFFVDP